MRVKVYVRDCNPVVLECDHVDDDGVLVTFRRDIRDDTGEDAVGSFPLHSLLYWVKVEKSTTLTYSKK